MYFKASNKKHDPVKRLLCFLITVLLIAALSSMTFADAAAVNRTTPPSSCCEGGDCCILSDCVCPNCEGRGEPGEECSHCGGDLCENCGNCYDCGTSPCPVCRDYCFSCGSTDLCDTCNGCLDCGHNRDPECPECGDELLPINENDDFPMLAVEDETVPIFSSTGRDFFLFAPFGMPAWAIFNLLLTLAGVIFSFVIIIRAACQKEHENREFDARTSLLFTVNSLENVQLLSAIENEERFIRRRRIWALVTACFLSFGAVLFLVLMQDFKGAIVLFDWWVIIHSILFVGILICGKLAFRRYEVSENRLYAPASA